MENQVMVDVLAFATVIGVVVGAFLEMIKRIIDGKMNKKYIPLIAFVIGLIVGAAAYPFTEMDLVLRLWAGGIAGWMSSGIYETVKQTKKI